MTARQETRRREKRVVSRPIRKKGLSWIAARARQGQRRRPAGVFARVTWRGEQHRAWFGAAAHGGRLEAMRQGAAWVRAKERELGKPSTDRMVPGASPKNKTGVAGVRRARRAGPRKAKIYVVDWTEKDGRKRRTSFSVARYGQQQAWRKAVALRRQKERELYGRPLPSRKPKAKRKGK